MTVDGLPLHPLLVHLVVVGLPVTALTAVLASLWPAAQRRVGVLLPLAAVAMAVVVPITVQAGRLLAGQLGGVPQRHDQLGSSLTWWAVGLAVVVVVQWLHLWGGADEVGGPRAVRRVLAVAVIAVSIGAIVVTVMTGDSGARSVWGS